MDEGSVCVANVTRSGRIRRGVMGAVVLIGTAVAVETLSHGMKSPWLLLAVPAIAFGWLCVWQAIART